MGWARTGRLSNIDLIDRNKERMRKVGNTGRTSSRKRMKGDQKLLFDPGALRWSRWV